MESDNTTRNSDDDLRGVNHSKSISKCLSNDIFEDPNYTDINLIVEGNPYPAHKIILAARSNYFRALLFGGLKEKNSLEIELKTVKTESFKAVLKYIYTGVLDLGNLPENVLIDVLELANQWRFEELEAAIYKFMIGSLHIENICGRLNAGLALCHEEMVKSCIDFAELNADKLLAHSTFKKLSPDSIVELISRDTFPGSEEEIIKSVFDWIGYNGGSHDKMDRILEYIRLPLLSETTLLEFILPTKLFAEKIILDEISSRNRKRNLENLLRGCLVLDVDVLNEIRGATVSVINGERPEAIMDKTSNTYTQHKIGEGNGINIRLGQPHVLDCIKMSIGNTEHSYSYYVEVSHDQKEWKRIADYTKYDCRSHQILAFPRMVIQYIKIVGTNNNCGSLEFCVESVAAFYKNNKDFRIGESGLLVPAEKNVALAVFGACASGGNVGDDKSQNVLLNGELVRHWYHGYHRHTIGLGNTLIQLGQPYIISKIKLLLWDADDRSYSYFVQLSIDKRNWETVSDKSNELCKSWQTIDFNPRPVIFIRIVGTHNTANLCFHLIQFECYGPPTPPPVPNPTEVKEKTIQRRRNLESKALKLFKIHATMRCYRDTSKFSIKIFQTPWKKILNRTNIV